MTQQINLLAVQFRKQRRSATSAGILGPALGLVLLLVLAAYAYQRHGVTDMRAELVQLENALKDEQQKQAEATQALAARVKDPALAEEVERLDRQLGAHRASLGALQSGVIGNTAGFSRHMLGFARQAIDGLWLTGFSIAAGGAEMSIEGRALRADLVPAYFKRLAQEPPFAGREFSGLSIGRPQGSAHQGNAEAGAYLAFRLTAGEPVPAAAKGVDLAVARQP